MHHGPFISAAEAKRQGLNRYFTGKPCKHGHVALRRTQDHYCKECERIGHKAWKQSEAGRASHARRDKAKRATALGAALENAKQCTHAQISTLGNGYLGNSPNKTTGLSRQSMKIHFTHMFKDGMNWDNYGTAWQVDHIRPKSSFDLSDRAQFTLCMSWRNLQPLSPSDNHKKGESWSAQQEKHWRDWITQLGYEGDFYLQHEN